MIYTLCISRHLTPDSTNPTDHPSAMVMGQIWDRLAGDQVDDMNTYPVQQRIYYFKTIELSEEQVEALEAALGEEKKLLLNCFSVAEKETLSWPGTMAAGMGGDITYANIEVIDG
jgi:hypothetical protein